MTNPKTAVAQIMKLKDLIAYQSGAVVSKTLVGEEGGTVTAFAFDEGQGLSEHTAPYAALVIVIEGQVDIKITGESFHLSEGEMIIMPPQQTTCTQSDHPVQDDSNYGKIEVSGDFVLENRRSPTRT